MKNIIFIFLICTLFPCFGQQNCTIKEYQANYTTYPYSDPNPIPAPRSDIYPYFQFSGYTSKAMHKEWRVVELENDFIKRIDKIKKEFVINDIEDFAKELKEFGEFYGLQSIKSWSERLSRQAEIFDLDNLQQTLIHFDDIFNETKNSIKDK